MPEELTALEHYREAERLLRVAKELDVEVEDLKLHAYLAFADLHLRLATAQDSILGFDQEEEDIRP